MTEPLLPCPFCGGAPTAMWHSAGPSGDDGYYGIDCCQAFAHADDEADAAEKWNRRAPTPEPRDG